MIKRSIITMISLLMFWQLLVWIFHFPIYIFPGPLLVFSSFYHYFSILLQQTGITLLETLLGFLFGSLLGILGALVLAYFKPARLWFLPILLVTQALPTFAIAPLFILWFGYGISSKIAVTMLMLFFPITSNFYDGLSRTPQAYLDMAKVMGASNLQTLYHIRIPAALPALASGLRIAATFAPMGAIIGEWVGASQGLGYLMMNANARMDISLLFAALIVVILLTLCFYFLVDFILKKYIWWNRL
jgi:putative hydroxymethylpyrimidine transport system permease protein